MGGMAKSEVVGQPPHQQARNHGSEVTGDQLWAEP